MVVGVDLDDAEAHELVQHRARTNVLAHLFDQHRERFRAALARCPRQSARRAVAVVVRGVAQPARNDLRAERHRRRRSGIRRGFAAEAANILAMNAGEQRQATVGGELSAKRKLAGRRFDEYRLEEVSEVRIRNSLAHEQPHERTQKPAQCGDHRGSRLSRHGAAFGACIQRCDD